MRLSMATYVLRIAAVTAALQGTAHANEILGVPRIVDGDTVQIGASSSRTLSGKVPGASQVTALLRGNPDTHGSGPYEVCFRAVLVEPWHVKLVRPRHE
jgi:hypothetical protein